MYQIVFLPKTFQGKRAWSQGTVFVVSHHPLQHTHITSTCSYTSCIDCIRHYNGTRAGPDLVGSMLVVVAYCCCILLQLALMLYDPDHCTLFVLVVLSFHQLVQILYTLAHVVVSTCCNLRLWWFSFNQLAQIPHLHRQLYRYYIYTYEAVLLQLSPCGGSGGVVIASWGNILWADLIPSLIIIHKLVHRKHVEQALISVYMSMLHVPHCVGAFRANPFTRHMYYTG